MSEPGNNFSNFDSYVQLLPCPPWGSLSWKGLRRKLFVRRWVTLVLGASELLMVKGVLSVRCQWYRSDKLRLMYYGIKIWLSTERPEKFPNFWLTQAVGQRMFSLVFLIFLHLGMRKASILALIQRVTLTNTTHYGHTAWSCVHSYWIAKGLRARDCNEFLSQTALWLRGNLSVTWIYECSPHCLGHVAGKAARRAFHSCLGECKFNDSVYLDRRCRIISLYTSGKEKEVSRRGRNESIKFRLSHVIN